MADDTNRPSQCTASGCILRHDPGKTLCGQNAEERFPIYGIFEGALFADLGNIWLFNPSDDYPGGNLRWGHILEEIAVGIGFGLRLNVSIATLRFDLAIPLYDPGFEASLRWRPPHWDFNQIVFNFGINYPF